MSASIWAAGTAVDANSTISEQSFTATANQTVFTITEFEYITGSGTLWVFVGGVQQRAGVDFTETSSTSFTMTSPVPEGTSVYVKAFTEMANIDGVVQQALDAAAEAAASASSAALYQAAPSSGEAAIVLRETSTTASSNYRIQFERTGTQAAGSTSTVGELDFRSKYGSTAYQSALFSASSYTGDPAVLGYGCAKISTFNSVGGTNTYLKLGSDTSTGSKDFTVKCDLAKFDSNSFEVYIGEFVSRKDISIVEDGTSYIRLSNNSTQLASTSADIGSFAFYSNYNDTRYKAGELLGSVSTNNPETSGYGRLKLASYKAPSGTGAEILLGQSGSGGDMELVAYRDLSATLYTGKLLIQNFGVGTVLRADYDGTVHISTPTTAGALASNKTMTFELTSDTQLTIKVRGSDGTTRSATLTLS